MTSQINNFHIYGSKHVPHKDTQVIGLLENEKHLSTTWILKRDLLLDTNNKQIEHSIEEILDFGKQHKLDITCLDKYHLRVDGCVSDFHKSLNIQLFKYKTATFDYHALANDLMIPFSWGYIIENIFGFNTSQIAKHHYKIKNNVHMNTSVHYYPTQVASFYNFPTGSGFGQTVGIIELGGGYVESDILTYLAELNINTVPTLIDVSVDGAINDPSDTSGANVEVILDIEIIVSIVPSATIRVYFAPNSDQGFYNAIRQAALDSCNVISISWGNPENLWSLSTISTYNTLFQTITTNPNMNVTIAAAAGDSGSSDGEPPGTHVDFPASSPYSIACGGTRVLINNSTIIETVWNNSTSSATGGGISAIFFRPSYQQTLVSTVGTRRGVPDIAANADPQSGYYLYCESEGGHLTVGGTSAVSPLWSALVARINQNLGNQPTCGYMHPNIYSNPSCFKDITQGSNGAYSAKVGYDLCTGLGSPNGQSLLNLFMSGRIIAPVASFSSNTLTGQAPLLVGFTDSSTNNPTSWLWTFGSFNATSMLQNPSYSYSTPGTYSVTLTVTNTAGSNSTTKTNYITVEGPPLPTVVFTANKTTGKAPLNVTFTNQSTGSQTGYLWNFGDRYSTSNTRTSTLANASHRYSTRGVYSVTFTVKNASGSKSLTKSSYIHVL